MIGSLLLSLAWSHEMSIRPEGKTPEFEPYEDHLETSKMKKSLLLMTHNYIILML